MCATWSFLLAGPPAGAAASASDSEPGLLFHLSAERGFTADYAGGEAEPNFVEKVTVIADGAVGPGIRCGTAEVLSYRAPGNIYAERGTLSFFWRSREPVGRTEFPIFRVGYADHSSWDMVWLRIDYNGDGFDAFVTDANLARVRVSYSMEPFPDPDEWVHVALAWDETRGIRLFVNGDLAAEELTPAVLYAGLDQFGPHARTISPMQVQSAYNFQRGGDIDEIRIYDRMLSDDNVAALAKGEIPDSIPALNRDLSESRWRDAWWLRYGWNRADDVPPYLMGRRIGVRKVEIHDVYDLKRWWWKGNDGIRETTWPGVYNRSRLAGRNDYFQLPDWDAYSGSGKSVTFMMPEEPWNHLEIAGAAFGKVSLVHYDLEEQASVESVLFERPKGQERTFHRLRESVRGGKVRFDNVEQETPIGELSAYYVSRTESAESEPTGGATLTYTVTANAEPDNRNLEALVKFIHGRFAADERSIAVALPRGAPRVPKRESETRALPIVHVLIPSDFRAGAETKDRTAFSYTWENMNAGLDGIAVDLPPLAVTPTHGEYFPLNIQVKDPIWPQRNMLDFTFSVKPGEAKTLWLDTRDRLLPNGKSLYLTVAGAGSDFDAADLEGAEVRLIFEPRRDAAPEHELDRFTQLRDSYAMLVEEHTNVRRLDLYNRFEADTTDLLRVNPDHYPARNYWYDVNPEQAKPHFAQPEPEAGAPLWAFRQVENLKYLKRFVNWYIDNRQIANGELGGGLSDDGDLANWWPGTALMGVDPDKIRHSIDLMLQAFYDQGLFTNGLATIQTDELHAYEEGIQVLSQTALLEYGSPKNVERLMRTVKELERLTGINSAGHRHFRSSYFSATEMSEEGVWEWSSRSSYLILHPALMLVRYNGNPAVRKLVLELADGLLAHRKRGADGRLQTRTEVHYSTDADRESVLDRAGSILWAAFRWTGDRDYLQPLLDVPTARMSTASGNFLDLAGLRETLRVPERSALGDDMMRHIAWQLSGDKTLLADLYADQIEAAALREYINTEGSLWIDRVEVNHTELQRARLGGVAIVRNVIYPGHAVGWRFAAPATDQSVAVLIPDATPTGMTVIAHNLDAVAVDARMTVWDVEPGEWLVETGIDTDDDDTADEERVRRTVSIERGEDLELRFAPQATTILTLKLQSRTTDYWERADLGIGNEDVEVSGDRVRVRVHSLGSVDAPAASVALRSADGRILSTVQTPALRAPLDLEPKIAEVTLTAPSGTELEGARVCIDPEDVLDEITRNNNCVSP